MVKTLLAVLFSMCACLNMSAESSHKIEYPLTKEPIDVVIVTHPKDKPTLNFCIKGIRSNCANIGRVIVVSSEKLTEEAEWFDEANFPFSKDDVALEIVRGDEKKIEKFFNGFQRAGWYYQQLLKLYAAFTIPDISSNVLVVDSDTIFLNPVKFQKKSGGGLFCRGLMKTRERYLNHAKRMLPGYVHGHVDHFCICHHMLFQKPILDRLFEEVSLKHQMPFWQAFCQCVDLNYPGASEFEIYYNFAFATTDQVGMRTLKWTNSPNFARRFEFQKKGYHFASFHTYLRKGFGELTPTFKP